MGHGLCPNFLSRFVFSCVSKVLGIRPKGLICDKSKVIKQNGMKGTYSTYGGNIGWKPRREETIWKTRRRWEDNIKIGIK
jgi:hypothetical protein